MVALGGGAARGQIMMGGVMLPGGGAAQKPGVVNLPYTTTGMAGGTWSIFGDGAMREQGMGTNVFAQGALLTIDGNGFTVPNNQGVLDGKSGELVLENPQVGQVGVTRHVYFDKDNNYVRYVDVFHNPSRQDRTVNVGLQTMLNYGVPQSAMAPDAKHPNLTLAWCGMTGMGRAVLEIYGGSGGKVGPVVNYQNGNNVIQTHYSLTIPAGKDAAILHLHLFVATPDAGVKLAGSMNYGKVMRSLPGGLGHDVVNFRPELGGVGDIDVLRGDVFDVVELRGGDQFRGTLAATDYKLDTFYGTIDLAADRVVGIVNIGQFRARQLLVTGDGEIFGGHLAVPTIAIALSSGQVVSIPLDQISRVGYRRRVNESVADETDTQKPTVQMRGGDRVAIAPPVAKIEAATRYGVLELDPASVAAVVFQSEDDAVHDIYLTDGSKITGLLSAETIDLKLTGTGAEQTVKFPVSAMSRLQLAAKMPDADSDGPSLNLINQDLLCGALEGELHLETAFGDIAVAGDQVAKISHAGEDAGGELQLSLWDGSTISGQIAEANVECRLISGAVLNLPVSLIQEYNQPHPRPSGDMVRDIQAAATDLGADDWRERDRAEAKLADMGPAVIGVLREVRPKMDAEAQQRIDSIIKKLEMPPAKSPGATAPGGVMMPGAINLMR